MTSNPLPESQVLTPLDPSSRNSTNSDEWPEFELSNARVYHPDDRSQTTSLLTATEHNPLIVVGDVQLHSLPKQASHLIRQQNHGRTACIELGEVRSFAYGQFEDGSVALWAAGKAGWFILKPARAYRDTYHDMIEAIQMLYFVADAYREPRRRGQGKNGARLPPFTAEELFDTYAKEEMNGISDRAKAVEKVHRHADFLLASMLAKKEGIDWSRNPSYLYLKEAFPARHEEVVRRQTGKGLKPAKNSRQQSVDSASTTSSLKRKRGRPPTAKADDTISIDSGSTTASSGARMARHTKSASTQPTKPVPARRTRTRPSPSEDSIPKDPEPAQTATPVPETSSSSSEEETEARRTAGKGRSSLRLKPDKAAKGKKGGKAPFANAGADAGDDEEGELASSPIRNEARLRDRRRNSRMVEAEVGEGRVGPASPPPSDSDNAADDDDDDGENTLAGAEPERDSDLSLPHNPDPLQEDTYLCPLAGCTHKIYLASHPESQKLIREHYALHAYDDDARVRMVRRLQAPALPAGRLVERVREFARFGEVGGGVGGVAGVGGRVGGSRFPLEPVRQRY